jgi:hypothetical protein
MQHFISHRGNINGKNPSMENNPAYIDEAISAGYDVEIDIRIMSDKIYLGHDEPQYEVDYKWLADRYENLWIHCKNVESLDFVNNARLHWFWHEEDTLTLTSKGYVWVYPGKQPIKNSIAVMPEINEDDVSLCIGICSDQIEKYKNEY